METTNPPDMDSASHKNPLVDDLLGDSSFMPEKSPSPAPEFVKEMSPSLEYERKSVSPVEVSPSPEPMPLSSERKSVSPDPKGASPEPHFDVFESAKPTPPLADPLSVAPEVKSTISEVKDFLDDLRSEPVVNAKKEDPFDRPLPPEPYDSSTDFLKSEKTGGTAVVDDDEDFLGARGDSPATFSREESPVPPPIPKHQHLRDDSPDRFESSPEPDFKPVESGKIYRETPEPPPTPATPAPPSPAPAPQIKHEPKPPSPKDVKPVGADIGAKDIIVEIVEVTGRRRKESKFFNWLHFTIIDFIDAWFNPARLHPQVESLVYWRDPIKSGVVFGVLMVTLLSLTTFSLISVIAYLGLLALVGTISFRVYKNIMQAVQKTSDGHPFKDLLSLDISLPEDKVAEISKQAAKQANAALNSLRSLFLVEDLVDSIKGLVLFWALTYIGAIFNGLTLLIIGVILVFALPRLYEQNKTQVDAYIQIAQEKLSIITNRMRAAIPSGKKEEKKDQ